jgi:AcrR family transcriptional regulator
MPRISKKPGSWHHGDLRRTLVDTAVRVVDKEGVAALSLHALAKKAGVTSGAPYHHFESREQLLAAIAAEGFQRLVAEMRRESEGAGDDPRAHLEGLGRGYVRFALAHRGHFRVMFRPELRGQLGKEEHPEMREAFDLLQRAIARCQAEGLAPPGDARRLVLMAWSAVHGASVLWIDGSLSDEELVSDQEALAATIAGTIVELLAAGRPRGRRAPASS